MPGQRDLIQGSFILFAHFSRFFQLPKFRSISILPRRPAPAQLNCVTLVNRIPLGSFDFAACRRCHAGDDYKNRQTHVCARRTCMSIIFRLTVFFPYVNMYVLYFIWIVCIVPQTEKNARVCMHMCGERKREHTPTSCHIQHDYNLF